MTDEELRYRMERVTERMAGADDTNEVVVSVALMRELFGRLEQMQAKLDAVPVGEIWNLYQVCAKCGYGYQYSDIAKWCDEVINGKVQP